MACYGCSSPRKAGGSAAALDLKIVVPLTGSLQSLAPAICTQLVGERWAQLPAQEREPYNEQARQASCGC